MAALDFWEVAQRIHLDLPAGYVRTSEEEEEGFKIHSGASVDDDGEVSYKFCCDVRYITADAEPEDSVYDLFDEMIEALEGEKGITLEDFPETVLSIREFNTAFVSHVLNGWILFAIVHVGDFGFCLFSVTNIDGDLEKKEDLYNSFLELLRSVRVNGKKIALNGITSNMLQNALIPSSRNSIDMDMSPNIVVDLGCGVKSVYQHSEDGYHLVDSEDDDDIQPAQGSFALGFTPNDIEVEEGATEIEADAYLFNDDIVFAVIPEGVEEIGDSAFYGCKNLEYVKLPDSVLRLQEKAFDGCEKLPYLIIPEGCQVIGADCFTGCKAMTDLYIPASVTEIGEDAFYRFTGDCDILFHVKRGSYAEQYAIENDLTYTNSFDYSNLPSVAALVGKRSSKSDIEFPEGITVIEEDSHSFDYRSTCLLIPEGVEEIQKEAFYGCEKLQYVKLPSSLRILGEGVFRSCEKLIRVDFPEGCRSIGADCFTGCDAMTDLYIPASVTEIGEDAFFHYPEDITLHVKRGSYAERYAIENNLKYVLE